MMVIPDRMMKIIRNAFKKCCHPSQAGKPTGAPSGSSDVPGNCCMKSCTAGSSRRPLATAIPTTSSNRPIGISQSRLNHLSRPIRMRGATPY